MASFTVMNSSSEEVEVGALCIGMYVSELDRPWLGTPFLLQGFLIDDSRQIDQLRECCQTVLIDRRRSVGDQYALVPRPPELPRQIVAEAPLTVSAASSQSEELEFLAVLRRLRARTPPSNLPRTPPPRRETAIEEELVYSAPVFDDVYRTLESIRQGTDTDGNLDLSRVGGLVEEMAAGVERNPDAMLWLTRLKITDQYSYDHAVDVSVHLMVFGRFLGLGRQAVEELGQAGLMQDIGKTQIDPEILQKPSALSDDEFLQVQSHVANSIELLANQDSFSSEVLSIVAAHHERYDGSGYPRRLAGERIRLHAELAGLIDTYCAMTRQRVFSDAISSQKALELLSKMRGGLFREALVDQFVQCVGLYPIGTLVELNTGEVAVVIQQNQVRRLKPRLLILLAQDKSVERRPRSLDLIYDPATPTGEAYRIKCALPSNAYGIDPAEFFLD